MTSDTRLEWPREEPLFELDSNKRRGQNGATIQVRQACGRWTDMAPTRKPESEDLNRCILYLTQDWNGSGRGHYSSRSQINAGVQTAATIQVISWIIIEIRHRALGQIL